MASFASSAATCGTRKHAWTKNCHPSPLVVDTQEAVFWYATLFCLTQLEGICKWQPVTRVARRNQDPDKLGKWEGINLHHFQSTYSCHIQTVPMVWLTRPVKIWRQNVFFRRKVFPTCQNMWTKSFFKCGVLGWVGLWQHFQENMTAGKTALVA